MIIAKFRWCLLPSLGKKWQNNVFQSVKMIIPYI